MNTPLRRIAKTLIWLVPVAVFCVALSGVLLRSTNCGGNTAALWICSRFASLWDLSAKAQGARTGDETFSIDQLREVCSEAELAGATRTHWVHGDFLVVRPALPVPRSPPAPVIVCSVEYGNVPQPTIWRLYRRNPAHAVGYSDGTFGLISPAEYQALDRSRFVTAESWLSDQ